MRKFLLGVLWPTLLWGLACGCAGFKHRQNAPLASRVTEDLRPLKEDLELARRDQVDALAPLLFKKAERQLKDAEKAARNGDREPEIFQKVSDGRQTVREARAAAEVARHQLPDVVAARAAALKAGAGGLPDFRSANQQFERLAQAAIAKDDTSVAMTRNAVLLDFRRLETKAIGRDLLGSAVEILGEAQKEGAAKLAPQTLGVALRSFEKARKAVENDPHSAETRSLAEKANFESNRLLSITRESKTFAALKPEDTALWVERHLGQVASDLGMRDERDRSFATQWDRIGQRADTLASAGKPGSPSLAANASAPGGGAGASRGTSSGATSQTAGTPGETGAQPKSPVPDTVDIGVSKARAIFDPHEAEVLRRGNHAVIQILVSPPPAVTMGSAMSNPPPLWGKIDAAIRAFGSPRVVLDCPDEKQLGELRDFLLNRRTVAPGRIDTERANDFVIEIYPVDQGLSR